MAIDPKQQPLSGSTPANAQRSDGETQNGIVTVNDEKNPTPEQRDAQIPNEPGTERLRSERQSVQESKRPK